MDRYILFRGFCENKIIKSIQIIVKLLRNRFYLGNFKKNLKDKEKIKKKKTRYIIEKTYISC